MKTDEKTAETQGSEDKGFTTISTMLAQSQNTIPTGRHLTRYSVKMSGLQILLSTDYI